MEQNSNAWREWRQSGIGASDAPIILGKSKYNTAEQLFLEKTDQAEPKKVNEFITGLGHKFEPRARAYYNLMHDVGFQPRLVEMEAYPWLRASLDGFYEAQPMEIKYVGAEKLAQAREGTVAQDHWIQMQHQLMVTGSTQCIYLCYTLDSEKRDIDEIHYHQVEYDKSFVLDELWPELFKFWEKVQAKEWS